MSDNKKYFPKAFIIFSAVILIAIFAVENINHRFWLNDFKVYYGGVQAFLEGTPVYGTLYSLGSGYYKYSPFTLLLALPVCILPYSIASIIQYFFLSATIIALFIVTWKIIRENLLKDEKISPNVILTIAFVCVINHLVRELHLGNINVVLLLLLCQSLLFLLRSKPVIAGILLAVVIITKPFFLLMLIPLILRKKYKVISSFGISMLLFVVSPALVIGFSKNIELHREWVHTLLEHNAGFPSNNTIENLVKLYIHSDLSSAFQFYVMMVACIAFLGFYLFNQFVAEKSVDNTELKTRNFIMEWFILIAIMPSLFKTDTQHFLLSFPLLLILLCHVYTARNFLLTVCFVLLVFMYGGNSSDMVGKALSARMESSGILGIGNLFILLWVILIHAKFLKNKNQVSVSSV